MSTLKKVLLAAGVVVVSIGYLVWLLLTGAETTTPRAATTPDTPSPGVTPIRGTGDDDTLLSANPQTTPTTAQKYADGSYTGAVATSVYGPVQVKAVVSQGRLVDVQFLKYPNDRDNSLRISNEAMPLLTKEAIQAQSAHVSGVSGATETSQSFKDSLSSALSQATRS